MKYRVHRLDVNDKNVQSQLEDFLNRLEGEVIMMTPHITKTTLAKIYGMKESIDYFLIVEKVA